MLPRTARIKNYAGIYHIMIRSISEVPLFKSNKDKNKYLSLLRKYQIIFHFKIYAYCLMTTHAHFILDCAGADISIVMKSINQSYAAYFNKKYNRHGHLFQDRFKSKLIDSDRYLITLSAYIHNNPHDIEKYKNCIEKFKYSSLGIYLGVFPDSFNIVSANYILSYFSKDAVHAQKYYLEFINRIYTNSKIEDFCFKNEGSELRTERNILIRNFSPKDIVKFITDYTKTNFNIHIKFSHINTELKSLAVIVMRALCNFSFKQIGNYFGNISISNLWYLNEKGYRLILSNQKYSNIIDDMILKSKCYNI